MTRRRVSSHRGGRAARPATSRPVPVASSGPAARPRVGVLGLQGDFALHAAALVAVGCEPVRVSLPEHLEGVEAMVQIGRAHV